MNKIDMLFTLFLRRAARTAKEKAKRQKCC